MYKYMYVHMHMHMHMYMYMYMYMRTLCKYMIYCNISNPLYHIIHMYDVLDKCITQHKHTYTHIYIYIYTYRDTYRCSYKHAHICIYTYIHTIRFLMLFHVMYPIVQHIDISYFIVLYHYNIIFKSMQKHHRHAAASLLAC